MLIGGSFTIERRDGVYSSLRDIGDCALGDIALAGHSLSTADVNVGSMVPYPGANETRLGPCLTSIDQARHLGAFT